MGSKFSEPRSRKFPVLTAPSSILVTILSTLVVLQVAPRVLPFPAPGSLFFGASAALVLVLVTLCTRRSRSKRDFGSVKFGGCAAVVVGVTELWRLATESNAGGFAVQLGSLGAEDSSAWTRIAGTLYWQDEFLVGFGYPVVILLSLVSGALRPLAFMHGQEFGTIGYSTLVVSCAFSALVMWIAAVCTVAYGRLAGVERRLRVLISVVVGLTLFLFVDEARELGHLTAALAAITLVTVLLAFRPTFSLVRSRADWLPLAVALLGASLTWLPMAFVGFYAMLFVAWLELKDRARPSTGLLLIVGTGLIGWTLFRGLLGRAEFLFTAEGATQSVSPVMLVATLVLLLFLSAVGSDTGRLIGPMLLVVSVLTVLLGDSYFNSSPGYGAVKMLWVVTPVVFSCALIEFASAHVVSENRRVQSALALGVIFVVFLAGVPQSVTQVFASVPEAEGSEIVAADIDGHWDSGYLEASRTLEELPVACVIWDEARAQFVPGWQGYLCSRYLGWSAAPTECRGHQWCEHNFNPKRFSDGFRMFGVRLLSLSEVLAGWAESGVDPSRTLLVIDDEGAVLDEVSVRSFVNSVVTG